MDPVKFHIPTKPYTIVDAINRRACAQGSMRYAQLTADADYNGHALSLTWNDYRGYYVGEYYWGERVVFARSPDFATALAATKREFERQGRGASCRVTVGDAYATREIASQMTREHDFAADLVVARADELLREGEEGSPEWRADWKWTKLQDAFMTEKFSPWIAATAHLIRATTEEEYAAWCDADAARYIDRRRELGQ